MSIILDWQGIRVDESTGKFKLVFSKEEKRRLCAVRCCRNDRAEEVYFYREKLIKTKRKICNKCRTRLYRANNPVKDAFRQLRSSAKKRKIQFDINFQEFEALVSKTNYISEKGTSRGSLHIDRIDPSQGYCFRNLQVLTCSENIAKGNRERFIKDRKFNLPTENEDPF